MAFQVIPETSFGSSLGQQLGSGLSTGLQQLAQQKLQDMQRQKAIPALQGLLPNATQEQLQSLLRLDPTILSVILKQKLQEPNQLAFQNAVAERMGNAPTQIEPQQPGQAGQAGQGLSIAGLTPKQQLQLGQYDLQQQTAQIKKQEAIRKANAPYVTRINEKAEQFVPIKTVTSEIKDLLNQPNIQWGSIKSLVPTRFQNEQTQALVSKLNELVLLKAQLGKGVPSKMRLELEKMAKPDIWQKPNVISYLVDSIDKSADEALAPQAAIKNIIAQRGGEPANLESLVDQQLFMKNLPSPSEYSEDAIIKVGDKRFGRQGNNWVPL